jgi:hypothetical protein
MWNFFGTDMMPQVENDVRDLMLWVTVRLRHIKNTAFWFIWNKQICVLTGVSFSRYLIMYMQIFQNKESKPRFQAF